MSGMAKVSSHAGNCALNLYTLDPAMPCRCCCRPDGAV